MNDGKSDAFYNNFEKAFEVFFCLTSDDDRVIGTVALKKLNDNTAELKALYLDSRYRGQGWGKQLINVIIAEARNSGYKTIVLDRTLKGGLQQMDFPKFMCNEKNLIPASQQNTPDIEGYYYTANDGSQMAFWIYKADRVSKEHTHDYDEWMLCVEGEYIVTVDGAEYILHAGDELFIPKGSVQGGRVKAGTRSIHAFGGQRVKA